MTVPLLHGYTLRRPTMDDLTRAFELTVICDTALNGEGDYTIEEFRGVWRQPDLSRDAWLVFAQDGTLAGYGLVRGEAVQQFGEVFIHPAHHGRGLGTLLLGLTEERARERLPEAPEDARVKIQQAVTGPIEPATRLFESLGYKRIRTYWRMAITLDGPPPVPEWPAGVSVRAFQLGRDERPTFEASDEAFEDHYGHLPGNFERWRERRLGSENFDPSLWFLAVKGETIAGISLCSIDSERGGQVDTLGVRRLWRGKGLGMALLRHSFGELYRRGFRTISLGVDSQNLTGATRLYTRAGMHVAREFVVFEKELRPGRELATQTLAS